MKVYEFVDIYKYLKSLNPPKKSNILVDILLKRPIFTIHIGITKATLNILFTMFYDLKVKEQPNLSYHSIT